MFTGIITGVGRIAAIHDLGSSLQYGKRLAIEAPAGYLDDVGIGDSIALNGACMTVTSLEAAAGHFTIDISAESLDKTAGLAEPGTLYEYAVGRIVIWLPAQAKVDVTRLGWNALLDASVQRIAIANPEHAPYGRAAVAALRKAGIYEQVKKKLVYGENISQAAQFVQSGNAQAGIVALSLAVSPGMREGRKWDIPAEMHPAIEQGAIVLKSATNKAALRAFLEFAKSASGRDILRKYGFEVPASR
jgi:molybdate transport system substrate-binding protein